MMRRMSATETGVAVKARTARRVRMTSKTASARSRCAMVAPLLARSARSPPLELTGDLARRLVQERLVGVAIGASCRQRRVELLPEALQPRATLLVARPDHRVDQRQRALDDATPGVVGRLDGVQLGRGEQMRQQAKGVVLRQRARLG